MCKLGQHEIPGVVYGLVDPQTKEIRYVGQTTKTLEERLNQHLKPFNLQENCPKNIWLKKLLKKGLKPEIVMLEKGKAFDLSRLEMKWIEHYRNQDCGLTNRYPSHDIRAKWLNVFRDVEVIQITQDRKLKAS